MKGGDVPEAISNLYDTIYKKLDGSEIENKIQLINELKNILNLKDETTQKNLLNKFRSRINTLMDQSKDTGEAKQPVEASGDNSVKAQQTGEAKQTVDEEGEAGKAQGDDAVDNSGEAPVDDAGEAPGETAETEPTRRGGRRRRRRRKSKKKSRKSKKKSRKSRKVRRKSRKARKSRKTKRRRRRRRRR